MLVLFNCVTPNPGHSSAFREMSAFIYYINVNYQIEVFN